MILVGWFDGV